MKSTEKQKEWKRNHYQTQREYYRARQKRRIALYRETIKEAKSRPCADCSIQYPYYVMQFDHLRDKLFSVARVNRFSSLLRLKEEISKCEVVCANCHAERTHKRKFGE